MIRFSSSFYQHIINLHDVWWRTVPVKGCVYDPGLKWGLSYVWATSPPGSTEFFTHCCRGKINILLVSLQSPTLLCNIPLVFTKKGRGGVWLAPGVFVLLLSWKWMYTLCAENNWDLMSHINFCSTWIMKVMNILISQNVWTKGIHRKILAIFFIGAAHLLSYRKKKQIDGGWLSLKLISLFHSSPYYRQ